MFMADRRRYGSRQSPLFEVSARRGSSDPAAASHGSMRGDSRRLLWRTAWKQDSYLLSHLGDQRAVLLFPPQGSNRPGSRPFIGVQGALLFRFFQGGVLHEDAMPLITPARPAETHHHGGAVTVLCRTSG